MLPAHVSNPSSSSTDSHFMTKASQWTNSVVLIVDDEAGILQSLSKIFAREGLEVLTASNGEMGLEIMRKQRISVLLTDLMMPRTTGMDLLKAARTVSPETEVILMTAHGTVETAVAAMKEGAYDFVTKPLKRAHVVRIVRNALDKQNLVVENRALRAQLEERRQRAIVGTSLAWRRTMDITVQAAASEATVLLLGESGTGKELLARAVHENSPRADQPLIPINCAAIPESILEAELFGYEKGAFTGATTSREGRFEAANGGTLFLDEIGEMSRHVQVKLLRVLQEGEIERLGGGGKTRKVDIRLIAATNVNLAEAVRKGEFREDLYYRLNVVPIQVPALRDRAEDIPLLVQHFTRIYASKNGKEFDGCSPRALELLSQYSWPGNVRELENAVERSVVLSRNSVIEEDDLPREIRDQEALGTSSRSLSFSIGTPLDEIEMRVIRETLRETRGDKRLAAKLLGIATRTIYRRLESQTMSDDGASPESTLGDGSQASSDGEEPQR